MINQLILIKEFVGKCKVYLNNCASFSIWGYIHHNQTVQWFLFASVFSIKLLLETFWANLITQMPLSFLRWPHTGAQDILFVNRS